MGIRKKIDKGIILANKGIRFLFEEDGEGVLKPDLVIDERVYENSFVISSMINKPKGKIIELGDASNQNVLMALFPEMGFDYCGVDRQDFPFRYGGYRHVTADAKEKLPFSDGHFDYAISISTIEHIGVGGRYGENEDLEGDKKAVSELSRVLKKGGTMLVTVPFNGKQTRMFKPYCRTYDLERIRYLFDRDGLKIKKIRVRVINGSTYEPMEMDEAVKLDFQHSGTNAVALIEIEKGR